jgi:DNA-binding response OmpR family regulator
MRQELKSLLATPANGIQGSNTLKLDESDGSATIRSARVHLRRTEFALLQHLLSSEDPIDAEALRKRLYPSAPRPRIKIINVHVHHLRKKLKTICGGVDLIETLMDSAIA